MLKIPKTIEKGGVEEVNLRVTCASLTDPAVRRSNQRTLSGLFLWAEGVVASWVRVSDLEQQQLSLMPTPAKQIGG